MTDIFGLIQLSRRFPLLAIGLPGIEKPTLSAIFTLISATARFHRKFEPSNACRNRKPHKRKWRP